jgi:tetratricopeptide (TPR) repeat protein
LLQATLTETIKRLTNVEEEHVKQLELYSQKITQLSELSGSLPEHAIELAQQRLANGDSESAEELFEKAAVKAKRAHEENVQKAAQAFLTVAELAKARLDLEKARNAAEESVNLFKESSHAFKLYGEILQLLGRIDEARSAFEKALQIVQIKKQLRDKDTQSDSRDVNCSLNNALQSGYLLEEIIILGEIISTYALQNNFAECVVYQERAMKLLRESFDPEGTGGRYSQMKTHLAHFLFMTGVDSQIDSLELYTQWKTLANDQTTKGGIDEIDIAVRAAAALESQGHFEKAIEVNTRLLELDKLKSTGKLLEARGLVNIASLNIKIGNNQLGYQNAWDAISCFQEVESVQVVHACFNLANKLAANSCNELAMPLYMQAEKFAHEYFGPDSAEICSIFQAIAISIGASIVNQTKVCFTVSA